MASRVLRHARHRRPRSPRTLVGALAVIASLAIATVITAPGATGRGKIKCKETTGTAIVDPIVHHNHPPNMPGMGHLHQFFGNNAFLSLPNPNAANYTDLVGKGTNCDDPDDTAGYWAPTLTYSASGAVVPTAAFTAYYRSWNGKDTGEGVAMPADTRLIGTRYDWTCGQRTEVEPSLTIPDCSGGDGGAGSRLTAHINFPTCWDGVKPSHLPTDVGDTRDNAHYAYRLSNRACPPGFPVKVVELRMTIQYAYTGDGTDLELSSDRPMGRTDGQSLHADFWNAWVQSGFERMVRDCVNPGRYSRTARCS